MNIALAGLLCAVASACAVAHAERTELAQPGGETAATKAPIVASKDDGREWPLYGGTSDEQRFSPLRQINPSNVGALGLAWEFDDFVVRGHIHRGNEATPLVVEGVMYFSGPWSVVYAVDARSGKLLWKHDPEVDGQWARRACCDAVNRGVAFWRGRVYVATFDGYLVALDAKSGRPLWRVDTFIDRVSMNYSSTGAPRIMGRNIVIGNGGAEMGARGYVSAYDLATGKSAWRFYIVPGDPRKGPDESPDVTLARRTWSVNSRWDLGGGGTAWDSMVYDPTLNLLYLGTGNGCPHPVWTRSPGGGDNDNLFVSSIVALDATSGRMRWYYQTTPGDSWDYTATQNIILADLEIGGKTRQVLIQAPKNGFFYVLDRATGELLSAKAYSTVTWAKEVNLKTGRPVFAAQGDYSQEPKMIQPSQAGAHNWMPMSYSASERLVYIPTLESAMVFGLVPGKDVHFRVGANNEGDTVRSPTAEDRGIIGDQRLPGWQSVLKAWDPVTGEVRWQTPSMPFWGGGVLSTAAGLVFEGSADGVFTVYDGRSGQKLKSLDTGTGIMAGPIAYELDGVEYIAVLAGLGGAVSAVGYPSGSAALKYENTERLLVFKLGGGPVALPAVRHRELQALPSAPASDAATLAKGRALFARCAACHAFRGAPNAYPDLWNLPPAIHGAFDTIVLEGALSYAGMPSFGDALSKKDVRAIQAFIISDEIAMRQAGVASVSPTN
jgi:quinohemoprotein ethanol dehydrogenase